MKRRRSAQFSSRNYFDVIELEPALGRSFEAVEPNAGYSGDAVAVISHSFWQSRLGGNRTVLGSSIELNGGDRSPSNQASLTGGSSPRAGNR